MCVRRQLELQAGNHGFLTKSRKQADFLTYFKKVAEKRHTSISTTNTWNSSYQYLFDYCGGQCSFECVTQGFVENFKAHLMTCHTRRSTKTTLSPNSASTYFTCFLAVIKEAVKDKLFPEDPAAKVKNIPTVEANREFLTIEELHRLAQTRSDMPDTLRRAALLSALTGMRFSDIKGLKWEDVHFSQETGYYLRFKIKKTGENLTLPISDEAHELLGEHAQPNSQIFHNLDYGSMTSVFIARWALAAGITKTITFHCLRHTFATAQLTLGTDLYTVSKMLGHKSVSKTQIYARIIDEKKREAANKISLK